ncbi:unnamed protein product, partial [Rotaria sp. Silwood1]
MLGMKFLLNFILCNLIFSKPQINFHYTDVENENEISNGLRYHCLRVTLTNEVGMKREFKTYYCIDNKIDEENCWQLEINECNDNEYQCTNGQCISVSFFRDNIYPPDCLDGSDEYYSFPSEPCKYDPLADYSQTERKRPNMYQCINSTKCISINRLMDDKFDCPQKDDEDMKQMNNVNSTKLLKHFFTCEISNKFIHLMLVKDGFCDCHLHNPEWCEYDDFHIYTTRMNISFQYTCNGYTNMHPILIEGKNETDETECEQWPCNNIYTRCDGLWFCLNGADEVGCNSYSRLNCST